MLQRVCEQLEYAKLLDTAADHQNSCLRLAYTMAFSFSINSCSHPGRKKPFNPILGETFEFVPSDESYKFISEQVSHHPPVSAEFTEASKFQFWSNTEYKPQFKGTSMEIAAHGTCNVLLKKYKDHITYNRPTTSINNIIMGTIYVDNIGEIDYTNHTTGDIGHISLKKRGWGGKGAFEGEGWVKDKDGNLKYTLHGKWNSHLMLIDVATKQETKIWEKNPIADQFEEQYSFTQFAKQLNYLNQDLLPKLPPTDNRLRPDQRALEYGLKDLAADEKHRVEEKQRTRRKELKAKGEDHKPKWFKESKDSSTGEVVYIYNGGYWECRERGDFGECLDIF